MDQHPIPRQITSFEFKLIGFMTLRQFLYLVIFFPIGFLVFRLFPIPLVNIGLGALVAIFGLALAFVPINERPLEVWIRNFIHKLNSPTQFVFKKSNKPIHIFDELYFVADPHRVFSHIDSQKKLSAYLSQKAETKKKKKPVSVSSSQKEQVPAQKKILPSQPTSVVQEVVSAPPPSSFQQSSIQPSQPTLSDRQTFFTGIVKNGKQIPLPGILIYVKDSAGVSQRLLKTNPHGIFATYNPLPQGEYQFDIQDPVGMYFFDTIKIMVKAQNLSPFEIKSKELL